MEDVYLPDVVNEFTKICRVCLNDADELYSIHEFGKVANRTIRISEILSECTSIECHEGDHLPATVCAECLLQMCKILKFREMAMKSNILLRQRTPDPKSKRKHSFHKKSDLAKNDMILEVEKSPSLKPDAEVIDSIQVDEHDDPDNEVEYLTVILANDESAESGDETVELVEDITEDGSVPDEEYIIANEIPKMSLKKHRNRRHAKDDENRSLTCPECGKTLSNFSSYKYHMQLHSDETPFLCNHCGQGFKTKNAYDGHMITHKEDNPNRCNVCGKTYRQAASLRSHMLTHTGEKPFKCEVCGKGMTQKSGYKKHLLTHTGEKPHSCEICNREFRYSSNLIMHKRSHVGLKEFECSVCKKKFISKEQLKRHAAIHTGVKPYKCTSCSKCFNRRSTLTIHQKIHKKFKCKFCSECFDTKITASAHEKTHVDDGSSIDSQQA